MADIIPFLLQIGTSTMERMAFLPVNSHRQENYDRITSYIPLFLSFKMVEGFVSLTTSCSQLTM